MTHLCFCLACLFFMESFDFNQISNIDTLKCRNFLAVALYPKLHCWTIYFNLPFLKLMDGTCCYLRQLKQTFTIRVWLFLLKLIFNAKSEDVYTFLITPMEIFIFYFTPGNSRQNKSQPLDTPQNCVRSLGNLKAKNKDSWKFHIIFFWSPLEIPLHF